MLVACVPPGVRPPEPTAPSAEPEVSRSLSDLGDRALAAGDLDTAEQRYRRALEAFPPSQSARLGLARVARRRGDTETARARTSEILAVSPGHYDALVELSGVLEDEGETAGAMEVAGRAIKVSTARPEAHAALARLTGRAPPAVPAEGLDASALAAVRVRRAGAHPYDPAAAVAAARALIEIGDEAGAARWLRGAWWMADVDPESGLAAIELLRQIDPDWKTRRVVPVHTVADDRIRRSESWKMRMRFVWTDLSQVLHPLLDTVFVPVSIGASAAAGKPAPLDAIRTSSAWGRKLGGPPGLVAILTDRRPRARNRSTREGEATFLGRHLTVRLDAHPSTVNPTLVHEVLHIYGAVHVSPEYPSIMNPRLSDATGLDEPNTRIATLTRDRSFEGFGIYADVLDHVDEKALIPAYRSALKLNLLARQQGMGEAIDAQGESRYIAARRARKAVALDSHLGDVASFLATLMVRQERWVGAVRFLDLASKLYGPDDPRAEFARARADAILARTGR